MKTPPVNRQPRAAAFTLIEVLISTSIMAMAGGSVYLALTMGLNQFAKNISVNAAHQQLLQAFNHMERDVHASLSVPQLLNADLTPYTGTGSAAGIALQRYSMGPFNVSFASYGATNVNVATGSIRRPTAGQRMIIEDRFIEKDITAVTPAGNNSTITIASTAWSQFKTTDLATFVDRVGYVVWKPDTTTNPNGELRYYPNLSVGTYRVLAKGLRSATAFSFGTNPSSGTVNPRALLGSITIADPTYNQRGYQAIDLSVTFQVPYRGRIAYFP